MFLFGKLLAHLAGQVLRALEQSLSLVETIALNAIALTHVAGAAEDTP